MCDFALPSPLHNVTLLRPPTDAVGEFFFCSAPDPSPITIRILSDSSKTYEMWTLSAGFDGTNQDDASPPTSSFSVFATINPNCRHPETKLLKTDKAYPLGRKDSPLCINVKKISRNHGTFTVDKFTVDDVVSATPCTLHSQTKPQNSFPGEPYHPPEPRVHQRG